MSEQEWRQKHTSSYDVEYFDRPCASYRMIHTHLDQARYTEEKIKMIQELLAQMFSLMTVEQQEEIMQYADSSWELVKDEHLS
jgi:5-bromo-4-chloroindolyl phosphate hydrolysis protein